MVGAGLEQEWNFEQRRRSVLVLLDEGVAPFPNSRVNKLLERAQFRRIFKNNLGKAIPIQSSRPNTSWKKLADSVHQCAAWPLKFANDAIGIKHGDPGRLEHLSDGRLSHSN